MHNIPVLCYLVISPGKALESKVIEGPMWGDNPNIQRQGFVIKSAGTLLLLWMKKKAYHFPGPKKITIHLFPQGRVRLGLHSAPKMEE